MLFDFEAPRKDFYLKNSIEILTHEKYLTEWPFAHIIRRVTSERNHASEVLPPIARHQMFSRSSDE